MNDRILITVHEEGEWRKKPIFFNITSKVFGPQYLLSAACWMLYLTCRSLKNIPSGVHFPHHLVGSFRTSLFEAIVSGYKPGAKID